MCGIFSAIKTKGFFPEGFEQKCIASTEMVAYRGPDAQGIRMLNSMHESFDDSRFNIFLGHRRLSIIDLSSASNQPMELDGCIIIYNGEIFNYLELRQELQHHGQQFIGESDTEVILRTYKVFGTRGFSNFNGMWAFLIVDLQKKLVICSRDRFSIKPLYYYQVDDTWFFSSEIKQILPFIRNRKLNELLASQFMKQQLLDHTNSTLIEGINKVPAKSTLVLDLETGEHFFEKYWDFEPTSPPANDNDVFNRFHELLDDSVRIRMRSDVEVGALLSGGLDSSAVTVLADKYSPGRFGSFSVVSHERKYSEEHFIDQLIKHHPLPNAKLHFDAEMVPKSIDTVLYHQDQPFGSLSVVAQFLMFQLIKDNSRTKVILSGQGGDEIMLGYLKYYFFNLIECKRKGDYLKILKEILGSLINRTVLWQLEWNEIRRYVPGLAATGADFILKKNLNTEAIWNFESVMHRQQSDIDRFSVPVLAHYEDRNSMAASIESRLPFLDHRLVNFLLGLPIEMKMKNGWPKYVLRKSIHELPQSIRWRRDKRGFITPEVLWLKNRMISIVKKEFEKSLLHEVGIIDKKRFLNYYDQFINGKKLTDSSLIFRTFILEKWLKMNFD